MAHQMRLIPLLLLFLAIAHAQRTGFTGNTCPDSCPILPRAVCGTNNRVYLNECVLQRAACNSDIRKKHDGPCVRSANNDCDRNCSDDYDPVCASNGITYGNKCKLSIANCKDSDIDEEFIGVCAVSAGPSASNSRPSGQSSSSSSSFPSSSSQSSSSTSSNARPGLLIGAPVRPIFPTAQRPAPSTQTAQQPAPAAPVVNTPRPVRNCRNDCRLGFRPVCGTDDQTYDSICMLRVAICKNPNLGKKNDGVCVKDCSIQCPVEINYVCGTDDKTYVNECELIVARCKDPSIKGNHKGPCVAFRGTECRPENCERISNPVCGSDGNTYENMCKLRNQGCYDDTLLRLHDGQCQVQKCGDFCPAVQRIVCGTDGVTYPNHCILINEACKARSSVVKAYDGQCRQSRG